MGWLEEPRRRDRVLVLAVPLVATLVALVAVLRYHAVDQVSWRGVGFGMFATYEEEQSRFVVVQAVREGRPVLVRIPEELEGLRERVAVSPSPTVARELGREVLHRSGADRVVVEVRNHTVSARDRGLELGWRTVRRVTVP